MNFSIYFIVLNVLENLGVLTLDSDTGETCSRQITALKVKVQCKIAPIL